MKTGQAIKKPIPVDFIELLPTWTSIRKCYEFIHGQSPYTDNASYITKEKFEDYMDICIKQGFLPLKTLESGAGTQNASLGDYILKGIDGECWPIKADIFERTYDIIKL